MSGTLPGWALTILDDGVDPVTLARPNGGGAIAVFNALVRTAAAGINAGMTQSEWQDVVEDQRRHSGLIHQLRLREGRRIRPALRIQKDIDQAWAKAQAWITERGAPWSRDDLAAEIESRAAALQLVTADADADLTDADRLVLDHAVSEARRRQMTRVTMPRRAVGDATGVGERSARTALRRLVERGLLIEFAVGRSGAPGSRLARASVYELPEVGALEPYQCPGTGPMGHPAQTYGTPPADSPGTPPQTYGTPSVIDLAAMDSDDLSDEEFAAQVAAAALAQRRRWRDAREVS